VATTDPHIAVVGPGDPDPAAEDAAYEVGRLLAQAGAFVVTGGLGATMKAASRGAKEGSGTTVGILPGDSRSDANEFVDVAITTGMGEARNTIIVRTADGLIAVGGGFGTLSEIGFALKLGKPVVGLQTWELSKSGVAAEGILEAATPEEAVKLVLDLVVAKRPVV
jgi:uncharacterized protein (TIGR00725 family)